MKYLKSVSILIAFSVPFFIAHNAQAKTNDESAQAASTTPAAASAETKPSIPNSPLEHSLSWRLCKAEHFDIQAPKDYYNSNELFSTILAAAITKGVDLIGSKLKKGAEEKTHTASATVNITKNMKEGCLTFKRNNHYEFVIALPLVEGKNNDLLNPKLVYYKYNRSIDGKSSGDRGVVLQIEFSNPRNDKKVAQTVNLGNLEIEKRDKVGKKLSHSIPLIQNPFIVIDEKTKKRSAGYPFVASVTMTEVKDANEILSFFADVADESNDKVTEILIKAVGVEEEENVDEDASDGGVDN